MLRIIKIVMSKTYVQKALILNGFFMLAQPPGERERTITASSIFTTWLYGIATIIYFRCVEEILHYK